MAMLPVAQLYLGDVPHLRVPTQADMMQVLWCPFDHPEQQIPKTALFWRPSTRITDVLASAPQPAAVQHEGYVPQPCLIHPAQVTEYPAPLELEQGLRGQVEQWSAHLSPPLHQPAAGNHRSDKAGGTQGAMKQEGWHFTGV
ncbi:hypothetical protein ACLQ2Y_14215 [Micromonospora echinospora]|uniref:hypothetical protein n=1 Tax=Micromonospora echinospora TaxID=1877 RepID=UPI003CF6E6A8